MTDLGTAHEPEVTTPAATSKAPITRAVVSWVVVVAVAALILGGIIWYRTVPREDVLTPGSYTYPGTAHLIGTPGHQALCYVPASGTAIVTGFSLRNSGGHAVHLSGITVPAVTGYSLKITTGTSPETAEPLSSLAIAAGGQQNIYVDFEPVNADASVDGSVYSFTDVAATYRAYGVEHTQNIRLADEVVLWGPDVQGPPCATVPS
jgi:hypothetical protein